jgi:hypothetical protein
LVLNGSAQRVGVCLIHVARVALLLITLGVSLFAQARPFEIIDNSFFVEEAFNQDAGVVQNIFSVDARRDGGWEATFTQEWPIVVQRHQFSYTVPYEGGGRMSGLGDAVISYRLQALTESTRSPAFSPRVSLVVPTSSGSSDPGWQVNLPFSKQVGDAYVHLNAGFTRIADTSTPSVAASGMWRLRPMLNVMFDSVVDFDDPDATVTLSPGLRTGWNRGDSQIIFGIAVPVEFAGGSTDRGVFGYFSYELPFRNQ